MADEVDPLDDSGKPLCTACGTRMETAGGAGELDVGDSLVVNGYAYWRCPSRGFLSLV